MRVVRIFKKDVFLLFFQFVLSLSNNSKDRMQILTCHSSPGKYAVLEHVKCFNDNFRVTSVGNRSFISMKEK